MTETTRFGTTLAAAVDHLRTQVDEPLAAILVVAPMDANVVHARRELAVATDFLRVYFTTPNELVRNYGRVALAEDPRRLEPSGWLAATIATRVLDEPEAQVLRDRIETLRLPGWARELARAVRATELAGVTPDELDATGDERAAIVAATIRAVEAARDNDGLYGEGELIRRGVAAIESGGESIYSDVRGIVSLADGELAGLVHRGMKAFANGRPVARVTAKPFDDLAPAPLGLRDAAPTDETFAVEVAPEALGHLQRSWTQPATPWDGSRESVTLAATPDESREGREAVRRVLDAIEADVPLDRIAIAVPDAENVASLQALLDGAGIPATFLTGPSIAIAKEARFLRHALALADGDDDIVNWYELLMTPRLLSHGVFRGIDAVGRGRWRRILSECGATRGTAKIRAAIEGKADELSVAEDHDPDEFRAVENLANTFTAFADRLAQLPRRATLGEHADAWRDLLKSHMPRFTSERETIEAVLEGWGRPGVGVPIDLSTARAIFEDALADRPNLRGYLLDRAIVVGPPMALFGRDFELVCVCGLNQGRLPRDFQEDLLLTDATVQELNAGGQRMLTSDEVEFAEERRFAAALSAASGAVWLSAPRTDLDGRPMLPSVFVLEAASTIAGRRVSFEDLPEWTTRIGSRSSFTDADASRAVTATEFRVARLRADAPGYLPVLASHRWARGQLQLLRSIDRLANGGMPDAWTGLLSVDLADPVRGDEPAPAYVFDQAVTSPGRHLFRRLLGGWSPPRLYTNYDPRTFRVAAKLSKVAFEKAVSANGFDAGRFNEAFRDAYDADTRFQPDAPDGAFDAARALAGEIVEDARELTPEHFEASADVPAQTVELDSGWKVEHDGWRTNGAALLRADRVNRNRKKLTLTDGDFKWALDGLAARRAGETVEDVAVLDFRQGVLRTSPFGKFADELYQLIDGTTRRARARFYPIDNDSGYGLSGESALGDERIAQVLDALEGGDQ